MRTIPFITSMLLVIMISQPLMGDDQAAEESAKFRRDTRLGFSLSADFWSVNGDYDSENDSGSIQHAGDLSGDLVGFTLFAFRAPSTASPIFGELSFRGGELTGDIQTQGNTVPYVSQYVTTRQEIELRAGTVLRPGTIDVHGSIGGMYLNSDTERTNVGGPDSFSASAYLGSMSIGLVTGRRSGPVSFGARLDPTFLLGMFEPEHGDGAFVLGYDTRLTAFADYEIPLSNYDLVFQLKLGAFARDYFGQDTEFTDISTMNGIYGRLGVSVVF